MISLYGLLRERCGLSLREAAEFHRVATDTVTSWSAGRRMAPAGVLSELRDLYEKIDTAADQLIALAAKNDPETEIEVGLASDDHEARSLGWPCVGAQAASIGLAAAYMDNPIRVVPRGMTLASAAGADVHDKSLGR